jgi:hypothetical protein
MEMHWLLCVEKMRIITFIENNKSQFTHTNKIEDHKLKKALAINQLAMEMHWLWCVEKMRIIAFIMNNKGQISYTNKRKDRKLKSHHMPQIN